MPNDVAAVRKMISHGVNHGGLPGVLVAEVHRIRTRGGVFMYPMDEIPREKGGKLRPMFEANPMAFVVAQTGGAAINGRKRIMDLPSQGIHPRVPVVLGSKNEVDPIASHLR